MTESAIASAIAPSSDPGRSNSPVHSVAPSLAMSCAETATRPPVVTRRDTITASTCSARAIAAGSSTDVMYARTARAGRTTSCATEPRRSIKTSARTRSIAVRWPAVPASA